MHYLHALPAVCIGLTFPVAGAMQLPCLMYLIASSDDVVLT